MGVDGVRNKRAKMGGMVIYPPSSDIAVVTGGKPPDAVSASLISFDEFNCPVTMRSFAGGVDAVTCGENFEGDRAYSVKYGRDFSGSVR